MFEIIAFEMKYRIISIKIKFFRNQTKHIATKCCFPISK